MHELERHILASSDEPEKKAVLQSRLGEGRDKRGAAEVEVAKKSVAAHAGEQSSSSPPPRIPVSSMFVAGPARTTRHYWLDCPLLRVQIMEYRITQSASLLEELD